MSKCHPNHKKLKRQLRNESNKLDKLQTSFERLEFDFSMSRQNVAGLTAKVEEQRMIIRDLGNDRDLKSIKNADRNTLVSTTSVYAEPIELKVRGRVQDDIEHMLVQKIVDTLIKNSYVRIKQVDPDSREGYEDRMRGTITYMARLDVIPWYMNVRRDAQVVCLDREMSMLTMHDIDKIGDI